MDAPARPADMWEVEDGRRLPFAPVEGWTTVGLVVLLALTVAWSIDDASWVLGRRGLTDFLPWAASLGVAWGFLSAKLGWPRWLAHLLGAVAAALVLPVIVGSILVPQGGNPVSWFQATAGSVVDAYLDLAYRGLAYTTQIGHFLLVLAILCWALGQFAAYAVFHHRRPANAVVLVGAALVANMALTIRDQLPYLIVCSLAGLFLLIRSHAHSERSRWARHRIGDTGALGGRYLRAGSLFVAAAVTAALLLTAGASSAPLASLWNGADQRLIAAGRELQRVFRAGGPGTRLLSVDFGASAPITGSWTTDSTPVLRISVPDDGHYYWRAVTYDHFDGRSWSWTAAQAATVAPRAVALAGTADDPRTLRARRQLTLQVTELGLDPQAVFAPDAPLSVDVGTSVTTVGAPSDAGGGAPQAAANPSPDGTVGATTYFAGITASASSYQVTALVPIDGVADPANGLTANKLRVAGTAYPPTVRQLYLQLDPGTVGPATRGLLAEILARHPEARRNPYDLARAITTYLVSEGGFTYQTDVTGVPCGDAGPVECFAGHRVGYCEYYASTMAVLLRLEGVPARLAEGFLPGPRDATGQEIIRKSNSHAWVEVYFPGYGWIQFDPTGGGVGQDRALPAGPVVAAPRATPRPSPGDQGPDPRPRSRPDASPGVSAGVGAISSSGGAGPLIAVTLLLGLMIGLLAWRTGRRRVVAAVEPERAYRGVVRLAQRLGFAPRPSQTAYEYARALGEILPNARLDLQTVARAKVEVAYGRQHLGEDRLHALRAAQRRLRVALLRLLLRRRALFRRWR